MRLTEELLRRADGYENFIPVEVPGTGNLPPSTFFILEKKYRTPTEDGYMYDAVRIGDKINPQDNYNARMRTYRLYYEEGKEFSSVSRIRKCHSWKTYTPVHFCFQGIGLSEDEIRGEALKEELEETLRIEEDTDGFSVSAIDQFRYTPIVYSQAQKVLHGFRTLPRLSQIMPNGIDKGYTVNAAPIEFSIDFDVKTDHALLITPNGMKFFQIKESQDSRPAIKQVSSKLTFYFKGGKQGLMDKLASLQAAYNRSLDTGGQVREALDVDFILTKLIEVTNGSTFLYELPMNAMNEQEYRLKCRVPNFEPGRDYIRAISEPVWMISPEQYINAQKKALSFLKKSKENRWER